ncbi:hypothetical protein K6L09_21125 [Burkholderia cepacia]
MSINTKTHFVQNDDDTWYYYIKDFNDRIEYDSRTAFDQVKKPYDWDVMNVPVLPFKTLGEAEQHRSWNHANGFDTQIHYNHTNGSFTRDGFYGLHYSKKGWRIEGLSNVSEDISVWDARRAIFGGPYVDEHGNHKLHKKDLFDCNSVEEAKALMEELGLTQITIFQVQE